MLKRRCKSFSPVIGALAVFVIFLSAFRQTNKCQEHEDRDKTTLLPQPQESSAVTNAFFDFEKLSSYNAKPTPYVTDRPRNYTGVNFKASNWKNILPYKSGEIPSDALWMPILVNENNAININIPNGKVGFVYSAFLDTRFPDGPFVRVLAFAHRTLADFYCVFHPKPIHNGKGGFVKAEVEVQWPEMLQEKYPYLALFINCPLKDIKYMPKSVTVTLNIEAPEWALNKSKQLLANNVYIHGEDSHRSTPSLCMCSRLLQAMTVDGRGEKMWCIDDVVRLVEFIELHSIMGASVFHFYGQCYSKDISCILEEYYAGERIIAGRRTKIEFHNYEFPFVAMEETNQFGSEVGINDCLYRCRAAGVEFVANVDLDEIIFPDTKYFRSHGSLLWTLATLASGEADVGSFYFQRFNFPTDFADNGKRQASGQGKRLSRSMKKLRKVIGNSLRLVPLGKVVVQSNAVTGLRTHWVRTMLPGFHQVTVPTSIANIHHYRRLFAQNIVKDTVLKKLFATSKIDRTALAYERLFRERIQQYMNSEASEKCRVDMWQRIADDN